MADLTQEEKEYLFQSFKNPDNGLLKRFLAETSAGMSPRSSGALVDGINVATLADAVAIAPPGSTIYMGTELITTNDNLIGIDPTVNIWFPSGGGGLYDGTGGDPAKAMFDTTGLAAGWQGKILGDGTFLNTAADAGKKGVLNLANNSDRVFFQGQEADAPQSRTFWVEDAGAGTAVLEVDMAKMTSVSSDPAVYVVSGLYTGSIDVLDNSQQLAPIVEANGVNALIEGLRVNLLRGQIVGNDGFIDINYVTAENHSIIVGNAQVEVTGNTAILTSSLSVNAMYENVNGILNLSVNSQVSGATVIPTVLHNGGLTFINEQMANIIPDASAHIAITTAPGLIVKQRAVLLSNFPGTNSVFSAAPQNIKSYPGSVSNRIKGANVTELVDTILFDSIVQ